MEKNHYTMQTGYTRRLHCGQVLLDRHHAEETKEGRSARTDGISCVGFHVAMLGKHESFFAASAS